MTYISAELRHLVLERAGECCEYCQLHQDDSDTRFHVEHIIAIVHGGKTVAENLALSCARCNLFKGTNLAAADPDTGDPTFLFHPRRHPWDDHFQLQDELIEPLTAEGRVTVFLLRLNSAERIAERHLLIRQKRYPCH